MKRYLIKQIVCIKCKSNLAIKVFAEENKEILDGILSCKKCEKKYFIINGVPRLLPEELETNFLRKYKNFFLKYNIYFPWKDEREIKKNKFIKTVEGFGYEWKNFSQLHSSYENQFLDWISPVKKEFFKNKLVLDAGCGTGRHVFFSSKFGAEVIGIDLSEAVDVAFNNTRHLDRVSIIQADIYHLPFKEKTFDYVYSIGVLHHLPKPQNGFNCLVNLLKNNAHISAWVYGRENNFLLKIVNPIREKILSKLPLQLNHALALIITVFMYPIMFIYSTIDKATSNKKKNFLPQFDFLVYLFNLGFDVVHSIIFDQMLAPISNYYTKSEFEKWFKDAKLKNIGISWRNKNSWRGFAEK